MNAVEIEEAISAFVEESFVGEESRLRWESAYDIRAAGKNAQ